MEMEGGAPVKYLTLSPRQNPLSAYHGASGAAMASSHTKSAKAATHSGLLGFSFCAHAFFACGQVEARACRSTELD